MEKSTLRAYLRLFRESFAANLSAAMEYRANFLLQVFGMMLNNASFIVFWSILFDKTGSLSGYAFDDVMFLWALTSSAFGLAHVLCGNVRGLSEIVKSGDLDVYLLQPKDVLFNVLTSKTVVSGWGDFLYGYAVLAFLAKGPLDWLLFSGYVITGAVLMASVFTMAESLVFFTGSGRGITDAVTEFILCFSLYPEKVFPLGMRWIFYSVIPSGFIVFLPLRSFRAMDFRLLGWIALAAAAYAALTGLLFRTGLRRYESGNRIGGRS
jgi:ABC-2 type transport system permease protein